MPRSNSQKEEESQTLLSIPGFSKDATSSAPEASFKIVNKNPFSKLFRRSQRNQTKPPKEDLPPFSLRTMYTPIYIYPSDPLNPTSASLSTSPQNLNPKYLKPRYCSARLSRGCFICLHVLVLMGFMGMIGGLLVYFVIVPEVIRGKVRGLDLDEGVGGLER
jgi:hypothetical protein